MGGTPGTYVSWGQPSGFSGGRRRGLRPVTKAAYAAAAVFCVFTFVVSRDTHPAHEFIAVDQGIQFIARDAMKNRDRVAQAPLWASVPGATLLNPIRELLENDFGFPEWMLRNFVGGDVIVTGNDMDRMSDLLFITKMTTVGCVIQRMNRLHPGVIGDWAGGHHLVNLLLHLVNTGLLFLLLLLLTCCLL